MKFHSDLRNGQEVDVIEHLLGLRILSSEDYHEHGVDGSILFVGVNVSWA